MNFFLLGREYIIYEKEIFVYIFFLSNLGVSWLWEIRLGFK